MAHRKPLGTTCHTVADWDGDLPQLGDYLVTPAATWYRVLGVEEKRNRAKVGLLLERVAEPDDLARVFKFRWYSRQKAVA